MLNFINYHATVHVVGSMYYLSIIFHLCQVYLLATKPSVKHKRNFTPNSLAAKLPPALV